MTAWLLSFAIAVAATPAPLLVFMPPTIIHERVSPNCSSLHNLVLPLRTALQTEGRALISQALIVTRDCDGA